MKTLDEKLFKSDETEIEPMNLEPEKEEPEKKKSLNEELFQDDRPNDSMSPRDKRDMLMLQEVYSKKDIEMKSELNDSLIRAVTKGILYSQHFNVPIMHDLCTKLLELRVSKGRGGRKEFVDMARSMNSREESISQPDITRRLFGIEK